MDVSGDEPSSRIREIDNLVIPLPSGDRLAARMWLPEDAERSPVPALIEYLSGFMTLQAGDVILTGTPDGVVNVNAGDEVVTEIDGIGRLVNTLVPDTVFGR